jgi:sugar phosphate isomerase/epimerase
MVTVTEDRVTGAPIPPTQVRGESGKRLMQHFLDITDRRLCVVEMDIYWAHVAQYRFKSFTAADGSVVEDLFDPAGLVAAQTTRFPLFHAKDGLFTETGYSITPFGQGNIDYTTFFQRVGAKGYHNSMYEQDNAASVPAPASPALSLQNAASSYQHMASLRG